MTSPDRETDSRASRGSPFIPGAAGPPRRASFLTGDPGEPGSLVSNVASSSSSSYFLPRNLRSRRRGGDGSNDLISLSSSPLGPGTNRLCFFVSRFVSLRGGERERENLCASRGFETSVYILLSLSLSDVIRIDLKDLIAVS